MVHSVGMGEGGKTMSAREKMLSGGGGSWRGLFGAMDQFFTFKKMSYKRTKVKNRTKQKCVF